VSILCSIFKMGRRVLLWYVGIAGVFLDLSLSFCTIQWEEGWAQAGLLLMRGTCNK
jgi:hypothetical protein